MCIAYVLAGIVGGIFFFFNDTATTEIYTLSLHDALPICDVAAAADTRDEHQPQQVDQVSARARADFNADAGQIGRAHV